MAAIDDLIAQVEDEALRARLRSEAERLTKEKKFGLVFEEHLPELTPIYSAQIRRGSHVALRGGALSQTWRVLSVNKGNADCLDPTTGIQQKIKVSELVVVSRFGEPIFPTLTPVDRVQNGPDDAPWHTLIEADNYHALQLLEYLYAGQVDCIYIDPPYNTGARDWKYNNDYVDSNDSWRHSKWLAMMRRRLEIAKRLLREDGALICAIDDNELAHLWMLLKTIFPERTIYPITIQHNPGGTQGDQFSVTHEYALFVLAESVKIFPRKHLGDETYNLRRWGSTSTRFEAANCFYPIRVRGDEIVSVGSIPDDSFHPDRQAIQLNNGDIEVWPIDKSGVERKWRYARNTVDEVLSRTIVVPKKDRVEILLRREHEQLKTVWIDTKYNAEQHGTKLITNLLGKGFSYPKSIYAVSDCLDAVLAGKKSALVLDFFAGSGTTMHSLDLLNVRDAGNRRCILVTNNEVSEDESKSLNRQGKRPGDAEWEQQGICRSVAWPRCKYTILGQRDDGTELKGNYLTGKTVSRKRGRTYRRLGFIDPSTLTTAARKKEIVSLIDSIPMSAIKSNTAFFASDDEQYTAAILFDDTQTEAFLEALDGLEHITHFYIVTGSDKTFRTLKAQIEEILGPIEVQEEEKRPMAEGFPANLEYFKLDFLEKDRVALGQQFREILPLLWLRAGAIGPRPELPADDPIPPLLIPDQNPFAVLVDESRFADFLEALAQREDVTHVFLVTDSEEAFQEMAAQIAVPHIIQLYRDYLENFAINQGEIA